MACRPGCACRAFVVPLLCGSACNVCGHGESEHGRRPALAATAPPAGILTTTSKSVPKGPKTATLSTSLAAAGPRPATTAAAIVTQRDAPPLADMMYVRAGSV